VPPLIFRKGLDLKHEVAHVLAESYHSNLVTATKDNGYRYESGRLTIHLAKEFGFCYGVDRAVDYAYQARRKFGDRQVFLTGEIIHNPHVNEQLRAQGIRFLSDPGESLDRLCPDDVVILPAFGITIELLQQLTARGCNLVDTTCGSVLNVWKNVKRYADEGFTSIIHGKYWHEETQATASQARRGGTGQYLVVLDKAEANHVCDYIRDPATALDADPPSPSGADARAAFIERFQHAVPVGFDPDLHLQRVGCANQTTMLSTESLEIGEMFKAAIAARYGEAEVATRFRAFDTICSATQDRQDAVIALLASEPLDLMLVIGGYNSSNTFNLARICAGALPTFHIAEPAALRSSTEIRHRPVGGKQEVTSRDWLPAGPVRIGLTSGASTPDNLVDQVMRRLDALANI
jgi:4-hydroxy-3-methylbut-2-enyl diphosphate reductase